MFSLAIGVQKLGHPVPESNLVAELNTAVSQQMQRNTPLSWTFSRAPVNGVSVSACRVTSYDRGGSSALHSASVFSTAGTDTTPFRSPASVNSTMLTSFGGP